MLDVNLITNPPKWYIEDERKNIKIITNAFGTFILELLDIVWNGITLYIFKAINADDMVKANTK